MDGMTINHIVSIDHGSWEDAEGFFFGSIDAYFDAFAYSKID
jgi:hypothetical protein